MYGANLLTTHEAGGKVTEKDVKLAKKIEALAPKVETSAS